MIELEKRMAGEKARGKGRGRVKIEKQEDGRRRIWLTAAELGRFGLSFEGLAGGEPRTNRFLRQMLRAAELPPGVGAWTVEAIPIVGGCILSVFPSEKGTGERIYRVRDLEALYALADGWSGLSQPLPKSALYEWGNEYRLVIESAVHSSPDTVRLLERYTCPAGQGVLAAAAVQEHGRLLAAENALERLISAPEPPPQGRPDAPR